MTDLKVDCDHVQITVLLTNGTICTVYMDFICECIKALYNNNRVRCRRFLLVN